MVEIVDNIIKSFKKERYGLHICLKKDKQIEYYLLHIKQSKNSVKILNKFSTTEFDLLKKALTERLPISIYISGNGVLIKKTKEKIETNDDLFKNLFRNIDSDKFYIQSNLQFEYKWIAIIRKDAIQPILREILKLNVFMLGVTIIPPITVESIPLPVSHDEVLFGDKVLIFNNYLTAIEQTTQVKEYELLNCSISSRFLPSFFISTFLKDRHLSNYFDSEFSSEKDYKIYQAYNKIIGYSAVLLLILLSLNFATISYYNNQINYQKESLLRSEASLKQINELKNARNKKRRFVETQNVQKGAHHCMYINEISRVVPNNIILNSITISPIRFKSNKLSIDQNSIIIEGVSYDGIGVTEFIKYIKEFSWVESIKLVSYKKNKENSNSIFQLKIDLSKGESDE